MARKRSKFMETPTPRQTTGETPTGQRARSGALSTVSSSCRTSGAVADLDQSIAVRTEDRLLLRLAQSLEALARIDVALEPTLGRISGRSEWFDRSAAYCVCEVRPPLVGASLRADVPLDLVLFALARHRRREIDCDRRRYRRPADVARRVHNVHHLAGLDHVEHRPDPLLVLHRHPVRGPLSRLLLRPPDLALLPHDRGPSPLVVGQGPDREAVLGSPFLDPDEALMVRREDVELAGVARLFDPRLGLAGEDLHRVELIDLSPTYRTQNRSGRGFRRWHCCWQPLHLPISTSSSDGSFLSHSASKSASAPVEYRERGSGRSRERTARGPRRWSGRRGLR